MKHNFKDWAYLNEEGMKLFSEVFPDQVVPIVSILPIVFEHPNLESPSKAFLLNGKELSEKTIQNLIIALANKFKEAPDAYPSIRQEIINNRVPVRCVLTSGFGTRRPQMYSFDGPFELEGDEQ